MFQGFSEETGEFLWELRFHNERPWFQAHREQFERCLNVPLRELAKETLARFQALHPELELRCHVSRIYRDARRLFGRGPYKDHLWFSLLQGDDRRSAGPVFWFEISPASYGYGMGFYEASAADMERFRRTVDANPARFERLAAQAARMKEFKIVGAEYARPKGDYPEPIRSWYSRKWPGLELSRDLGGDAFSPELPDILCAAYEKLLPLYRFFLEIHQAADEAQRQNRN